MKQLWAVFVGALCLIFFGACFALPVEEPTLPSPVINIPDPPPMRTVVVERGDIARTSSVRTTHMPLRQEAFQFNVHNQRILGVYVQVGDDVAAGDILAEIENPAVWEELERVRRDEAMLLLQLSQLAQRHEFALNQAYETGNPVDDTSYIREQERLAGQLGLVRIRLENLERDSEMLVIRATFDGVVVFALGISGFTLSQVGQNVVTIADQGTPIFRMLGWDADIIEVGQVYSKTIGLEHFYVEAIDPDAEGITRPTQIGEPQSEAFFRLLGTEAPVIGSGTLTFVNIVHESVENVLVLPNPAINSSPDRTFVFVVEDGLNTMRDIEIGMTGDGLTEIISGLNEGEVVSYGTVFVDRRPGM
ncbi:MAG: efflux RND transporter periplasmic adaptor subunit [Defluviitaleaceae bacterium]|nr:efflux RND transporter periplasmic adaptor subunit [Defluviitaleaceae bacterium]